MADGGQNSTLKYDTSADLTRNFYTQFRGVLERVTLLSTSWMGGRGRSLQASDVSYYEM